MTFPDWLEQHRGKQTGLVRVGPPSETEIELYGRHRANEALERAADIVREHCQACGGSGGIVYRADRVTHEMALDTGDPNLEGTEMHGTGAFDECQYCGEPARAIRAMKAPE